MKTKDISAPGDSIVSTSSTWNDKYNGYYKPLSGTSMAAPCIAGVLALVFSANPSLTAEQAVSALYATATDIGDDGWDEEYGYGEVDANSAVSAAIAALTDSSAISTAALEKKDAITEVVLSKTKYTYTGKAHKPAVSVYSGSVKLENGRDYSVSYSNNVAAGKATVTVKGEGDFEGTKTARFTIEEAKISKVVLSKTEYTYTGNAKKPATSVYSGSTKLVKGTDYTVAYAKNVNAGTATVTVKGINNCVGTKSVKFTIAKRSNVFTVKAAKATQNAKAKKTTTIAAKKAFKVTKNTSGGAVTYKKISGNSKITVSKSGKITVKKGLTKGKTYTLKVKASSKATKNYKSKSRTVIVKIKVK